MNSQPPIFFFFFGERENALKQTNSDFFDHVLLYTQAALPLFFFFLDKVS